MRVSTNTSRTVIRKKKEQQLLRSSVGQAATSVPSSSLLVKSPPPPIVTTSSASSHHIRTSSSSSSGGKNGETKSRPGSPNHNPSSNTTVATATAAPSSSSQVGVPAKGPIVPMYLTYREVDGTSAHDMDFLMAMLREAAYPPHMTSPPLYEMMKESRNARFIDSFGLPPSPPDSPVNANAPASSTHHRSHSHGTPGASLSSSMMDARRYDVGVIASLMSSANALPNPQNEVDVAACWCRLLPNTPVENGRVLPTMAIAVSSSIRGQRVGSSVLDAFLICCGARSVSAVRLTVSPRNTHAIALYRSRSFIIVHSSDKEIVMHWYGHGVNDAQNASNAIDAHHHTSSPS